MKKILLFATLAALTTGCSDDMGSGGGGDNSSYVLLKKTVVTEADGSSVTTNYNYDGNKLTTVTHSNGSNETYAYTDNYVTEVRHYENGGLVEKEAYTYGPSGLATHISYYYDLQNPSNNNAVKYEYSYNGNTVTANKFTGDDSGQTVAAGTVTLDITSNGNIIQYQYNTTTVEYNFDMNSSPTKEIVGYQAVVQAGFEGGANNVTTKRVNTDGTITNSLSTYTYNLANYPVTATHTAPDGSISTTAYTY